LADALAVGIFPAVRGSALRMTNLQRGRTMNDPFLDDEEQIANEREQDEWFRSHALWKPMSELGLRPAIQIGPSVSVREAIDAMIQQSVGCLLIVDKERLVGVFSERDVLRKVAGTKINADKTPVSELMTPNPATLKLDNELVYALHQMTVGGYRHIPLLDDQGQPVCVVSMRDIVAHIVSLYADQVLRLPDSPDRGFGEYREGA
jgi:CBS domain-containing protein